MGSSGSRECKGRRVTRTGDRVARQSIKPMQRCQTLDAGDASHGEGDAAKEHEGRDWRRLDNEAGHAHAGRRQDGEVQYRAGQGRARTTGRYSSTTSRDGPSCGGRRRRRTRLARRDLRVAAGEDKRFLVQTGQRRSDGGRVRRASEGEKWLWPAARQHHRSSSLGQRADAPNPWWCAVRGGSEVENASKETSCDMGGFARMLLLACSSCAAMTPTL